MKLIDIVNDNMEYDEVRELYRFIDSDVSLMADSQANHWPGLQTSKLFFLEEQLLLVEETSNQNLQEYLERDPDLDIGRKQFLPMLYSCFRSGGYFDITYACALTNIRPPNSPHQNIQLGLNRMHLTFQKKVTEDMKQAWVDKSLPEYKEMLQSYIEHHEYEANSFKDRLARLAKIAGHS